MTIHSWVQSPVCENQQSGCRRDHVAPNFDLVGVLGRFYTLTNSDWVFFFVEWNSIMFVFNTNFVKSGPPWKGYMRNRGQLPGITTTDFIFIGINIRYTNIRYIGWLINLLVLVVEMKRTLEDLRRMGFEYRPSPPAAGERAVAWINRLDKNELNLSPRSIVGDDEGPLGGRNPFTKGASSQSLNRSQHHRTNLNLAGGGNSQVPIWAFVIRHTFWDLCVGRSSKEFYLNILTVALVIEGWKVLSATEYFFGICE